MVSWVIVKLPHQTSPKGDHIPHEQEYNTRHGISAIPNEICGEIRCQPRQPEVQQKPVVYLLLETALGWKCGVPACQSKRPHSHPNQHTEAELKLIRDMRRRNPKLGMIELWHRLNLRGYTRRPESLFRGMCKMGLFPAEKSKNTYKPKPYEQMTRPGERVQVDVKVVPRKCIADPELRLFQYTAIDEFTRLRFLAAYPEQSTYSSADFLSKLAKWYQRRGIQVECVQTDNGFEFTNRFSNSKRDMPTLFEETAAELGIRHKLIRPYTPRHNGKVERSHREDQKRFYSCHSFYSLEDFEKQLATHNRRANNLPMRPLHWLSPIEFAVQYV